MREILNPGLSGQADGGNYDGVETGEVVTATALAPQLAVSATALYVQASPGFATFSVSPTYAPSTDTILGYASNPVPCTLHPAPCTSHPEP